MDIDLSSAKFPDRVVVTGQEIDTSVLTPEQRTSYLELFAKVLGAYGAAQKPRVIVGLAGPTGSGKSVAAAIFADLAAQLSLPFRFATLGVDGFHYPGAYLRERAAGGVPLKDVKGRFDTYDVPALAAALDDFAKGRAVSLPGYSRETHDPVQNAVAVREPRALLLVEGLWLLFDRAGWDHVAPLLDRSIYLDVDPAVARDAAIGRHVRGGRTPEDAARYHDAVDAANSAAVDGTKAFADEVVPAPFYR